MSSDLLPPAAGQKCFENLHRSCVKTAYSPGPRMILYAVFDFGVTLTIFGNLLVMISILHFKQLHTPTNFLIVPLAACTDFLVGVTVMPLSTVRSVESCWYFGESYCKFHSCFEESFCYASIYHLGFISLDRYMAVTDPLVYPGNRLPLIAFTITDRLPVIAFLISWVPCFIDPIINAFLGFITPTYIYEILVWIAYYNSAMDPLIYAFFYPWFQKAIKLMVTWQRRS
ncbi:LOW QUALITY PROTEIN: trace amine-associated receptor 7a-like [Herpailurus yagouaroundi]|uniref:LOW QUALITY PROTEIN: trace amine-associated receptor 7a-like n=1 Tax=Herpailurus yagouaroundi TaxID=1608482 RepID=UPI001AD68638|nr:LOW QUALITY PROTEIN: trace amine-associated receptor 7a-like [Puma yagouaroundi]